MSKKSIKILLASGIFYPDIGGPAIHVRKIAEALHGNGYRVVVIAYGDYGGSQEFPFKVIRVSNKLSPISRRVNFLWQVFRESIKAKMLYAFNLSTAGLPVFIIGKLLYKKILIRVPGDPIWERIVESGRRLVSFVNYYKQGLYMIDRPWLFRIIKFILPKFDAIVFYTPLLSEVYVKYYGVASEKITIITNPVFKRQPLDVGRSAEPMVLFAGRFVAYKNLELVIRAFDRVRQQLGHGKLILIGEGPDKEKLENIINGLPSASHVEMIPKVDQETLFQYICQSWLGIGPALTEFNPNFILECLSFGRPILISRENGLSVQLPEEFLFDAQGEQELEAKLTNFFDPEFQKQAEATVTRMNLNQTWENVISGHLELLRRFDLR